MGKKVIALWLSLGILFSLIIIVVDMAPVVEAPIIYVDDDYISEDPTHKKTIQAAVDAAQPGDDVFVYNGTYYENVVLNKAINLIGINRDNTTIDANGIGDAISVEEDWVNITGFSLINGGSGDLDAGIDLSGASNCRVYNNTVSLCNKHGISLIRSSGNIMIEGNNIQLNNVNGIYLWESSNNIIKENSMTNNAGGIYLGLSSNQNIITNNNASGNGDGIKLWDSSFNSIEGNKATFNSGNGIRLSASSNNRIINNNVSLNFDDGFEIVSGSNGNTFAANSIMSHPFHGILFWSSQNNKIYFNNIVNNSLQATDDRSNQWDFGYPSGGNYWSDFDEVGDGAYDDYHGANQDVVGGDGIVDLGPPIGGKNPYVIDGDSQDNYPLMEPFILQNFIRLNKGWNLISIPLNQEEQNLTRVLGGIDGWYDAVQWYDPISSTDSWKHHKVGKLFGNDLNEINETMGFWIHIIQPGNTIYFYNGTRLTVNHTVTLHPGWNMVGYPSLTDYNRTVGLNNLTFDQEVNLIQWYDANTKTWHDVGENDYFVPGRGYWIHAKTKCDWEVPL